MTSSPTENEAAEKQHHVRAKFDFSIDHILNRAGNPATEKKSSDNTGLTVLPFPWLNCTRYCPPKIPRNPKRDGPQKRQLGRHPRIPFTNQQLAVLEEKFRQTPYLSSADVTKLSENLQLADIRVKIWFQNRRARERRERVQLETEQKLPKNSTNLPSTSSECKGSLAQQTPVLPDLKESNLVRTNSYLPASTSSIFPLLENYSVHEDIRKASFLLSFSSAIVNEDSN